MKENPQEEEKVTYQLTEDDKSLLKGVAQTALLFFEHEKHLDGESLDDYIQKKRARFYNDAQTLENHLHLGYAAILEILSQK